MVAGTGARPLAVRHQIDPDREAAAAHVADHLVPLGEPLEALHQRPAHLRGAAREVLVEHGAEHGEPRGGADRIAARGLDRESGAMVHDCRRPDQRRQRQPAAETLAEDDHVGLHAFVAESVERAAAPQAHLDLVEDGEDAVPPAAFLQRLEEACGRHDQAAVRHDWLDEDRRHLLRRAGRLELVVEHVEHGLGRKPRPVGVGVGQQQQAGPGQRVGHRRVARDAHRARHAAVVGADEGDEAGAAGRGLQHAGGSIVGVGARMAEPDASLGVSRHRLQQRLGEGRCRLVRIT